jgi:hypothetical protein
MMNGDERKSMEEVFEKAFKPLDGLITRLASADGMLAEVGKDVAVIKNEQKTQGREIGDLRVQVRSLHDKVDLMPDRWESDIKTAVESCRSQRDEITNVTNLTKERERAARESRSPKHRDSWLPTVVKEALRPFITLLVVAVVATGISIVTTRCGGEVDRGTLEETRHQLELVRKQLQQTNATEVKRKREKVEE